MSDVDLERIELEVLGDPDAPVCIDGVCEIPGMTPSEPAPAHDDSET